ncbi:hypothetical protein ACLBKU_17500 [Erythrobacter sp. NE805]|uniref:hypothetical protein n=1 Tax=Erythrobacter sp. NE805 TaxID=3389875 RepID=UPI00396B13A0
MSALPEGPWTIEPGANSHVFDARIMGRGVCLAFAEGEPVYDDGGNLVGIKPAPATLAMAAARELVEALSYAEPYLETLHSLMLQNGGSKSEAAKLCWAALTKARSAMSSARGER